MQRALQRVGAERLFWREAEEGPDSAACEVAARADIWGDVVLVRKDCPTSYHLAVVIDDAKQGISHVVRGRDLFEATAIHRLLQELLALPAPLYRHHALLTDREGRKLAKSAASKSLRQWRAEGWHAQDIRARLGFS
jgi:glutamyl-Q tRNA(Asp) synthetase